MITVVDKLEELLSVRLLDNHRVRISRQPVYGYKSIEVDQDDTAENPGSKVKVNYITVKLEKYLEAIQ